MKIFYRKTIKRIIDFLVSLIAIITLSPFFLLLLLVLRLYGHRKFFFVQTRVGYKEKKFKLFKLKSMTDEKDANGNLLPDEKRLTKAGIIIRKTSLDELPQLVNVLIGDMSIVGPRPLIVEYLPLYSKEQSRRHDVKPGITGWAQINGRNNITWKKKFELDTWYVDNLSFLLDVKILISSFKKIIHSEGISQNNRATVDAFTGDN
jgi:lipopolysaccharide/colanic/teichoic acid biosynthesis glycosyltransferase